jgi:hypothetical protein
VPAYETTRRFQRDFASLSPERREAFRDAIRKFVADLERGKGFRKGLRVKGVQGAEGIFEMTWAHDGRATFQYGDPRPGEPHVVWRRCGTHGILATP